MGQTILSLIQFFEVFEYQKKQNKKNPKLLVEICITIRSIDGQYGSNRNAPDAAFK